MTLGLKKAVLAAGLVAFTLWPLAQMELVRRFGISPWKLCGWGMYATPRIAPAIAILVQHGDEAPAPMRVVPADIREACEEFQPRRLWLGDLATPDEIGEMVLASNPEFRSATVRVLLPVLDTQSGMMRTKEKAYRFERRELDSQR